MASASSKDQMSVEMDEVEKMECGKWMKCTKWTGT